MTMTATPLRRPRSLDGGTVAIYSRASSDQDETESSVDTQADRGRRFAESQGATVIHYTDNDKSASRFATHSGRADYARMIADIEAGKIDYVWLFSLSRSSRDLVVYANLEDLCRRSGVGIIVKKRIYDLNDSSDVRSLGTDAVNAAAQSKEISENVTEGLADAAAKGRPHAHTTYGYVRQYTDTGRGRPQYATQTPHPEHAPIVVEIIRRIADGDPVSVIARDLTGRVPAPKGGRVWSRSVVTGIARNRAYIGVRMHLGRPVDHDGPCWPPLVSEELFHAAGAVLAEPKRTTTRPGRAAHLLSYLARCECGEWLQAKTDRARVDGSQRRSYACLNRCSGIAADELDEFVKKVITATLALPEWAEWLAAQRSEDPAAADARAEADAARVALAEWEGLASKIGPAEYVRITEPIKAARDAADARADALAVPPALRSLTVDWANVPHSRAMIGALADIRLRPVGKGRRHTPVEDRITWKWLVGPGA